VNVAVPEFVNVGGPESIVVTGPPACARAARTPAQATAPSATLRAFPVMA
jgi:hypothetical protein